jgi:ribose transport system ATP-binding protein
LISGKNSPGVVALDNVSFDLYEGEVHALLGENGAGKSTLIKILFGIYRKDSGRIRIRGEEVNITGTDDSYNLGIRLIPQELSLIPTLSVMENIYAGQLPVKGLNLVDWAQMEEGANDILTRLGFAEIDLKTRVAELTVSAQQMVAIARAFRSPCSIIVFDEPTSALSREETENLFEIIRSLKKQGVGIIYITHRLEEVPEIADRVTVMRDGRVVGTVSGDQITISWIVDTMTGLSEEERYPKLDHEVQDETIFEVRNITLGDKVQDVSFSVKRGEILGITGFVGAGKTELARILFGADIPDSGEIYLEGKKLSLRSPADAIKQGIALIPEDRRNDGLVTARRLYENITLPSIEQITRAGGVLDLKKELDIANQYIKNLSIVTPSAGQRAKYLSGGNQQKVVVAKWVNANATVFIFDEATRGIDVGAKAEIYRIMGALAKRGAAVINISMEFPEVLGISDRILVMHEGRIVAEMSRNEADLDSLFVAAGGQM